MDSEFEPSVAEIDLDLVDNLRVWVKKTYAPKKYRDLSEIVDHFSYLLRNLDIFWEDLIYGKGLAQRRSPSGSVIDEFKDKVHKELKDARKYLQHQEWLFTQIRDTFLEGSYNHETSGAALMRHWNLVDPKDPMGAALRAYQKEADEAVLKIQAMLSGKLLRAFTAFLNKYAGGVAFESPQILLEYNLGNVKVYYDGRDSPRFDPREVTRTADPKDLVRYLAPFQKAQRLLESKGFKKLWYGTIFVSCPKCGGENPYGKSLGVGAHYDPGQDSVIVYMEPNQNLTYLLIHELGHRYYFRFMSRGDRLRFDSYFGEVPATSSYGATDPKEDFAEVFAAYVTGEDLSRDQIERFRSFLNHEDRSRMSSQRRLALRYLSDAKLVRNNRI